VCVRCDGANAQDDRPISDTILHLHNGHSFGFISLL